ncbi:MULTISPECIES: TfuA-like protein [Actinosynnema]|uniref:TfuA-like protein n=1 Tax=Actinosynnema TaxID=40566 RepID=UPI0020A50CED|nr:TfuA-like protein [Actinosynnema pretiosum]MCP2097280.1 hypothetical protein [Actinosynnema pretiosum]
MHHVFVGPTLERSHPLLAAPGVRVLPPARHGDLFDPEIGPGDTVVLIDGVYHQQPAVRHKEILAVLGRGVRVVGAASIGALRAAELAPFGMVGVGEVFAAYAAGDLVGDDEVAVGQAPDGDWQALTWPLVNLRRVLELACTRGVLDTARAAALLAAWRAVYYPQRTTAAVRAVCRRHGEQGFADWLARQRARNRHFGDLKRADALLALRTALDDRVPRPEPALVPRAWDSPYYRVWSNAFARDRVDGVELPTADRLLYQQLFDPDFPVRWGAYLEHLSTTHGDDGEPGVALAVRLERAGCSGLAADVVFTPPLDLRREDTVRLLLAGESAQDRTALARHLKVLDQAARAEPGFWFSGAWERRAREVLPALWRCGEHELDTAAAARGLGTGERAVRAARRLVPGLLHDLSARREEVAHRGR